MPPFCHQVYVDPDLAMSSLSARILCQVSNTFRVDVEEYVAGLKKFNCDELGMGRVRVAKQLQWMCLSHMDESLGGKHEAVEIGGKQFCEVEGKQYEGYGVWFLRFATPVSLLDALRWVQIALAPMRDSKDRINVPAWAYVIPISQADFDSNTAPDLDTLKDLVTTHVVAEEVDELLIS
jgi:hypothetical protein